VVLVAGKVHASFTDLALMAIRAASTSAPPSTGARAWTLPAPPSGPLRPAPAAARPQALLGPAVTHATRGNLCSRTENTRIERAERVLRQPESTALRCALSSGRTRSAAASCVPQRLSEAVGASIEIIAVWRLRDIEGEVIDEGRRGVATAKGGSSIARHGGRYSPAA